MVRLAILGVAVLFIGTNLTFGVIVFALAGGMGPIPITASLLLWWNCAEFLGVFSRSLFDTF
jgi:hypothetical protein